MDKVQIILDNFDAPSGNFAIWSTICVKIGPHYFPDRCWSDATSSVLEMWIANVYKLICGYENCANLYFMDGDYHIKLELQGKTSVLALCIAPNQEVIIREIFSLIQFSRQLLSATEKLKLFYPNYSNSSMIARLFSEADKLRNAMHSANYTTS